jgi:hypothetical protein
MGFRIPDFWFKGKEMVVRDITGKHTFSGVFTKGFS